SAIPEPGKGVDPAHPGHGVDPEAAQARAEAAKVTCVAAPEDRDGERREEDLFGFESGQGRAQVLDIIRSDGEIYVPSELRGSVQDACLASHQERPNLLLAQSRKDSGNRAQAHT